MSSLKGIVSVPAPVEESRVYQSLRSVPDVFHRAAETAHLTSVAESLGHVTRLSWLYRWLTKEPEPDVIVIDLRETWTVGPFIAILDRVIALLAVAYRNSRLQQLSSAVQSRLYRSPIRYLSAVALCIVVPAMVVAAVRTGLSITTGLLAVVTIGSVIGTLVDISWPALRETRPVQLLIAAFEPPEPPDRES